MTDSARGAFGPRRRCAAAATRQERAGQSLVEFALVIPVVLVVLVAIIEFSFVFNAMLSINFASRDAALLAAEAGDADGADCVILQKVEDDVTAPADPRQITQVVVFWADNNGSIKGTAANTYSRTGSTNCQYPDGSSVSVPYSLIGTAGYPEAARCNILGGCGGEHSALDVIGVSITYDYRWHTPFPGMIPLLNGGPGPAGTGWTLRQTNAMRMEPVL